MEMTDRVIPCPSCGGTMLAPLGTPDNRLPCLRCDDGTIPERRKPTPNDRAVDRIKAVCTLQVSGDPTTEYLLGTVAIARLFLNMIEQETSRG